MSHILELAKQQLIGIEILYASPGYPLEMVVGDVDFNYETNNYEIISDNDNDMVSLSEKQMENFLEDEEIYYTERGAHSHVITKEKHWDSENSYDTELDWELQQYVN